jgi:hypothetical protein
MLVWGALGAVTNSLVRVSGQLGPVRQEPVVAAPDQVVTVVRSGGRVGGTRDGLAGAPVRTTNSVSRDLTGGRHRLPAPARGDHGKSPGPTRGSGQSCR